MADQWSNISGTDKLLIAILFNQVSDSLLEYYIKMANPANAKLIEDINVFCAFNFPGTHFQSNSCCVYSLASTLHCCFVGVQR